MSPDRRRHRGAHPEDARLFAPDARPRLRAAAHDLSWLLTRGYAPKAALKTVGDRFNLSERQRLAVARAACSDESRARRRATEIAAAEVAGRRVLVDGFNLIITAEAALGGGVLLLCRDGCTRDLSSVHGSYRAVEETEKALTIIGEALESLAPAAVRWLLDSPVSNSGRLAARIREMAAPRGRPWEVELLFNPDPVLAAAEEIVITSDSTVLDRATRWLNFNEHLIGRRVPEAWRLDLRAEQ